MKSNQMLFRLINLLLIVLFILFVGCTEINKNEKSNVDGPENSIATWVSAMNNKDVSQLYDLAPSEIRRNISRRDFVQANTENVLLKPGVIFSNPTILKKTSDGKHASLFIQLTMEKPGSDPITVYYTFYLVNEKDGWKVWTSPF
jgi:hypothetical protein